MRSYEELKLETMSRLLDLVFVDRPAERGDSNGPDSCASRSAGVVGARLEDGPPQLANTERVIARSNGSG